MTIATDNEARFEIDPRDYPRDKAYIGCISVWGLLILGFTFGSVHWEFWPGVAFGIVIFLAIIPYTISQRNRGDVIEVKADYLLVSKSNPKNTGFRLYRKNPLEITIEHVDSSGDTGVESTSTFNLWDRESGGRRRTMLGFFLSEEAKTEVAKELVSFLRQHDYTVTYQNKVDKNQTGDDSEAVL